MKKANPIGLEAHLSDPRFDELLGKAACLKLEIFAHLLRGDRTPLAAIAKRKGVHRQAVSFHARRIRKIYGMAKLAKKVCQDLTPQNK